MEIQQYFERVGFTDTAAPTLDVLNEIHHLHPLAIPFENLSSFMGEPVSLDADAVFTKLVNQGRGGYCFEHNLLLVTVLREMGFDVSTHAARVTWRGLDKSQSPRTHKLLKVNIDGVEWITDVGFGGLTMTAPLRLDSQDIQDSPHETFRITQEGHDYTLAVMLGDTWQPMYVFDLSTQQPVDYALANYFVATHPESLFVNNIIAARPYRNGRHALINTSYTKYSRDGTKTEKVFADPVELMTLLEDIFKIRLADSVNTGLLQEKLASLIAKEQQHHE